jgi:hypothetical protein
MGHIHPARMDAVILLFSSLSTYHPSPSINQAILISAHNSFSQFAYPHNEHGGTLSLFFLTERSVVINPTSASAA